MVGRLNSPELQLNKANAFIPKHYFWIYTYLFQTDLVSSKIYDKRDELDFAIENVLFFLLFDGYVSRSTSYGVYISQPNRFARVSSHLVM